MAAPTWSVGEVLAAADVNSWFVPLAAYKTAITNRTSTTRTIDPDLQVTLAANAFYLVVSGIVYSGGVALLAGWTTPAGTGGGYALSFNLTGTGEVTENETWGATPSAAAADGGMQITGMLSTGTSGGTFGFSWASSTGATVSVGAGSVLVATRIG